MPAHKDGFLADETPIEPGDRPSCATARFLRVGELKLVFADV